MHRIDWTTENDRGTCFAHDGLLRLPLRAAEAVSEYGLALIPQHALLLSADGPHPLAPGVVTQRGEVALTWQPGAVNNAELDPERTGGGHGAPCLLTVLDGTQCTIGTTPFLVGTHSSCNLRLDDAHVAPFHCVLMRLGNGVRIIDMSSARGTFVDGTRVQQATMTRRAALRLGHTRMILSPTETPSELTRLPSPAMLQVFEQVRRVAPTRIPVLISGESGAGKDLVAREIHELSGRGGPLISINAATLTHNLAASELFGHVRGAFTGAERDHAGAFLRAHEGTLFLDEIAELPLAVQAELLRAVELGRIHRLGEAHEIPVDVRIVAATHRDLAARVRAHAFREDLYHRLCVVPIAVPPLRERLDDIDAIAEHFLSTQDVRFRLSAAARTKLRRHPWRGNVRELLNTLRRACTFAQRECIDATDIVFLPPLTSAEGLDDVILNRVLLTYDDTQSVAATARSLGIRRSVVHRILKNRQKALRLDSFVADSIGNPEA